MLRFIAVSIFFTFIVAVCPTGVLAAVAVETVQARHDNDYATGLFGGVRPDGTFVFLYSENRGVRFYRLAPHVNVSGVIKSNDVRSIPKNTPIRIFVEQGKITAVEVLGGGHEHQ